MTKEDHDKRPRSSREQTTEAILDAAEELFSERGYTAVTVREIAVAAGVSHALVHRYLGSKEDVYRAMLRRNESRIVDAAPASDDLLEATSLMLEEAWLEQRRYLRLIAHSTLHGLPFEKSSGRFAATERLIKLAQRAAAEGGARGGEPADPRFVVASLVAMLLGWAAARDWLLPAAGIGDMDEEEFLAAFRRIVLDVERSYFSQADSPSAE
ncbi:MAG TPA: helix-turn-helix domain-containing protein [Thermoleophilia bacterium]|nr:helix-turn-helix domain-containing protein [Thermoleophilia bacterium]